MPTPAGRARMSLVDFGFVRMSAGSVVPKNLDDAEPPSSNRFPHTTASATLGQKRAKERERERVSVHCWLPSLLFPFETLFPVVPFSLDAGCNGMRVSQTRRTRGRGTFSEDRGGRTRENDGDTKETAGDGNPCYEAVETGERLDMLGMWRGVEDSKPSSRRYRSATTRQTESSTVPKPKATPVGA